MKFTIQHISLDSVDSTNSYAKTLDDIPGDKITVIRAMRQTGGRGRGGKAFFSDHEGGLWVSMVTPVDDISAHFRHNRAVSLAILETLKDIGVDAAIKWPNDIYCGDRKITGILLENIPDRPEALIIGFGINVNIDANDFPDGIRGHVTSIKMETGRETQTERLLEGILRRYRQYIGGGDDDAHRLYVSRLYKKGHKTAIGGRLGTFITVDIDGRLRLKTERGYELFSSGTPRFDDVSAEEAACNE